MSDYIMDLRRLVGSRPLLQCAASVIIIDEAGRLLLGKRTDNHKWGYAGGSMNLGESVEECARRELSEEFGLTADELEFFMVNSGEETHYIYPNGDEVYNVEIIYLCHRWHGDPVPQESEISELRFFPPDQLPEISDPIRPVFREYQKRFL